MKPDNLPGNLYDPQSWNKYSYCLNNPVNFNDPTGHIPGGGNIFGLQPPPGAYWDAGIASWWLGEAQCTIYSSAPLSVLMHQLGFSDEAIGRARNSPQGLDPTIKTYTVVGGIGHTAMSASLGGEEIWLSHGGDLPWYGKSHFDTASHKVVPNTESEFVSHYESKGDTVFTHTLNLSLPQKMRVIAAMNAGFVFSPKAGYAEPVARYNEFHNNCVQAVARVLLKAGVPEAWLMTPLALFFPHQALPLFTILGLPDVPEEYRHD